MNLRIKKFLMIILIFISILLSGCSLLRGIIPSLPNKGTSASWTVMVYIGGDQEDIEKSAWDSLDKMESVGSTDEVNIVVQLDPYTSCIGTYRYHITGVEKSFDPPYYPADIEEPLSEQDMTDPNVLTEFIRWAQENYPAEHYLLILSGHGDGCIIAPTKGIITDVTTGSGYEINIPDLVNSLEANHHIDILGFEACLMQMLEVAYEIGGAQDPPDYIVGSEGLADIDATWSYDKFLEKLTDNPEMYAKNPEKLCEIIVKYYSDIWYKSLSVLHGYKDTDKIKNVIDSFANALMGSRYQSEIDEARLDAKNYDSEDRIYKDLYDFAEKIRKDVLDCKIQAKRIIDLVNDLVYYKGRSGIFSLGSHGLSIYLPDTPEDYTDYLYKDLQFAINTKWDEFLKTVSDRLPTPTLYDPGTSVSSGAPYTISWSNSFGATSYTLQESTSSKFNEVQTYYLTDINKNFTHNVSSNTTYYYRVAAWNDSNQKSYWSNIVDIDVNVLKKYEYEIQWSNAESNGWSNPLGMEEELITSTAYDYDSPIYLNNWGKRHVGIDVHAQLDSNVFSIADGTIVKITRDYSSTKNNSVIIIKHVNSDHEPFFTIYGHVLAKDELDINEKVKAGESIGTIRKSNNPVHLHFGINKSSSINDFIFINQDGVEYGWGRVPADVNPSDYGWISPMDYLNTHQTKAVVSNVVAVYWTDHNPSNSQNIEHLINVFWDPYPEASGYKVYRSVNGVVEVEPVYSGPGELIYDKNVVQWHDYTNIIVGNTYSCYVIAYSDGWETAPSQETGTINTFLPPIYLVSPSDGEIINNSTPTVEWSPVGSNPGGSINFGTTELWVKDLTDNKVIWDISFNNMITSYTIYNGSPLILGHNYGWRVRSYGYVDNIEVAISQSEYWEFTYGTVTGSVHNLTKDIYYDTIQAALDDADNGDTIEVADGTYDEKSITFPSSKKVVLKSVNGSASTIIQATVISYAYQEGTTLEGFTITHASGNEGGGIGNSGYLNIKNCIISGNSIRDGYGAGISNSGTLNITGSTISGNFASPSGYGGWAGGGGIYNSGTLTITESTISDNSATYESGGIFNEGSMTIAGSTISGNSSYYGGGIFNEGDAILTIAESTISGNSAFFDGGGIRNTGTLIITGSTISGNYARYNGGAIEGIGSLLTITGSTISGNFAGYNNGGIHLTYQTSETLPIGGSSDAEKNIICGNYKIGESPSLDQQIRDNTSGSLYEIYKDTNYISAYCE